MLDLRTKQLRIIQILKMFKKYQILLDNLDAWRKTNSKINDEHILEMQKYNKLVAEALNYLDRDDRKIIVDHFINNKNCESLHYSRSTFYLRRRKAINTLYSLIFPNI